MRFLRTGLFILAMLGPIACAPAAAPSPTAAPAKPAATAAPAAKPTAAPVTTPAEKAPPARITRVRLSHAGVGIFRLPFYVAFQNGSFKEEGLEVEVVDTRSGSDAMKMLAGKAVEFSTGQLVDAVNLNKEGIPIQGVAMMSSKLGNSIVVRKDLAGQIKSMADLKGPSRTIGVTSVGSGTWQFAVYMAQLAGLKKEDLNFVAVGSGAAVIAAVKAGRVDSMSYADPEAFKMVEDGDAVFLIDMTDEATHKRLIGDAYLNNQIMVSADYARANPVVVQGFVNAIQRGLVWAGSQPPEAIARLLVGYPGFKDFDPQLLVGSLKRAANANPRTAVISKEAFDNAMKFPIAVGVISEAMPYEQLVNTEFAEKAARQYPPR